MLRRLFNFFAILSLLLCVTTCVLWVRSYWVLDCTWRVEAGLSAAVLYSGDGDLAVVTEDLYLGIAKVSGFRVNDTV